MVTENTEQYGILLLEIRQFFQIMKWKEILRLLRFLICKHAKAGELVRDSIREIDTDRY